MEIDGNWGRYHLLLFVDGEKLPAFGNAG